MSTLDRDSGEQVNGECDNTIGSFHCTCNAGYDGLGTLDSCHGIWSTTPYTGANPPKRSKFGLASSVDKVYVFGGEGEFTLFPAKIRPVDSIVTPFLIADVDGYSNDLHEFSPSNLSSSGPGIWTDLSFPAHGLPPSPRSAMGFEYWEGRLYVFYGTTGSLRPLVLCVMPIGWPELASPRR